jgi:microcin C transport system permease protein
VLFTGSLLIEVIFSLDGSACWASRRRSTATIPMMFGTLYFFGLIGLVMGILGDLMYTVVDPRIDFEGAADDAAQPPRLAISAPASAA